MFETSFILLLRSVLINIIIPLIPGIIFIRILFWKKHNGLSLLLLSWFLWVWVIANRMFDIQFLRFWIGIWEYMALIMTLLILWVIRLYYNWENIKSYINSIYMPLNIQNLIMSFNSLSLFQKRLTGIIISFVSIFFINSFIFTTNFPTYADDSFWNWNKPILNMLHDGGIKIFGETNNILARWRLWYPLHIPIYKAIISEFNWWYNDIYNNLFQYFCFLFGIIFIGHMTFRKTNNIFLSVLPLGLICSLPLVFIHSVEWYMDLPSAIYSILVIRCFYQYLEQNDVQDLSLGFLFSWILMYIKNDWFVVYMWWISTALILTLLLKKNLMNTIKEYFSSKKDISIFIASFIIRFLPFLIIKSYYNLWFNQAAWESNWVAIKTIHREIFDTIPNLFFTMDNYWASIIIIIFIWYYLYKIYHKKLYSLFFIGISGFFIFWLFLLVFLLTENYKFVLDQTTVNRVFSMSFLILYSFIGMICDVYNKGHAK